VSLKKSNFKVIGIVGRVGRPTVADALNSLSQFLAQFECEVRVEKQTASLLDSKPKIAVKMTELEQCDLVIVVGGDGSILHVARVLANSGVPVIGINRGGLGFLAGVSPDEVETKLHEVLKGKYQTEIHFLIDLKVVRDERTVHRSLALNDIVVNSGSITRMMDFKLFVDEEFVYSQRSDGLIIATPTGSTAYALSAGGPIMHPSLDALVVVPMFPHTLSSRPLVVRGQSQITVIVESEEDYPITTADSQVTFILHPHDKVQISKHKNGLNIVYPAGHDFYQSCRSKLDWGT